MTKYIPHIHPHQFPTAKIRTFRHTAVSHFTPILSQITAIKTTRAAPPSGGAALILSVSESDCLFSLRFRRGLVFAALLAALLVLQVDFRQVGVVVRRRPRRFPCCAAATSRRRLLCALCCFFFHCRPQGWQPFGIIIRIKLRNANIF